MLTTGAVLRTGSVRQLRPVGRERLADLDRDGTLFRALRVSEAAQSPGQGGHSVPRPATSATQQSPTTSGTTMRTIGRLVAM